MWQLLRTWFRRSSFEDAMDAEMRFHLERRTADLVARGLSPAAAARQARLEFGSIEKQKDEARASLGLRLLDELTGDLRYAARTLVRNRAFTATAVITLALGMGANTAIFSLIDALMLRSLPVHRPQDLVQLNLADAAGTSPDPSLSYPMVQAFDERRDLFDGVCGYAGSVFATGAPGAVSRVPGAFVTGAFYETLGLNPVAGRLIARADDKPGAPIVAVLSYGYWERQFVRSPQAIGRTVVLDGVPATIVGVSPPGFVGANVGQIADITVPVAALPALEPQAAGLLEKGNFWLRTLARPKAGLSAAEAAVRVNTVWRAIGDTVIAPHWPVGRRQEMARARFELTPGATGWTYLREIYTKPLWVLMAAVGLVLLIACANVASLLLARASARQREIAVRLAIGARRGRILRQLLVESALLALIGAACGLILALFSGRLLLDILSTPVRVDFDLTPNGHVLAFTAAAAMLTAILFGLAPALQSTASNPSVSLKEDARTATGVSRWLPSLVTLQVALSLVLLVGAGLFLGTLRNLRKVDAGFRSEGVLVAELDTPPATPAVLLDQVRGLPGVVSAALSTHTPLSGSRWGEPVVPAGQPLPDGDTALIVGAGPQFFETLMIPLLAGRGFTDGDDVGNQPVAIVNERYAQKFFAGKNPLGQHLTSRLNGQPRDLEIVGVARNTSTIGLRAAPPAVIYIPYAQVPRNGFATVTARVSGGSADVAAAMRRILQPTMPRNPLEVRPLTAQVQASLLQERLMATLAGALAALALVLASVGIYGLLAYSVARRTREIGVRMALGAQRRRVVTLILNGMRRPVVFGVLIGLPVAWAASRSVQSMLFGLTPWDPLAVGGAIVVLTTVAHAAAYLPARRAASVDPVRALRSE